MQGGLGHRQLLGADQTRGLRGLGHVHGDHVGFAHQLVELDHPRAQLGGAGVVDVRVVGQQVHAEGGQALGDQLTDAAEAHHTHGLAQQLGAREGLALPLALLHRGVGAAEVAQGGQDQRHRELGGRDDVGGGGVDHHHPGGGRGGDVDVVQAHAGAGDDAQLRGRGVHLRVDQGGGADQQGIGLRHRGEQRGTVGAVHAADLDVGAQDLDGGGRQLLSDEHDRTRHGISSGTDGGRRSRPRVRRVSGDSVVRCPPCGNAGQNARSAAGESTRAAPTA